MFKQIGDLNVNYDIQGSGYPLVLLHGGGSRSSAYEEMVRILSKKFTVYTYDLRGFGETVRPAQPTLTHELWRDDLRDFMDSVGLEKAAVAGWSLGGAVVLNYVLTYPERVSHVILIGASSPRLAASDRSGFEARRKLIESGATAEEIVAKTFEFTKGAFSPHSREHNPGAVEKLRQEHLKNDPQSYLEMLQAQLDRPELGPRLGEIKCPTFLIVGDADGRTPLPNSEDLNLAIDGSYMKVVKNCGHFYGFEQPEITSQSIIGFLKAFT